MKQRALLVWSGFALAVCLGSGSVRGADATNVDFFEKKIRPVLVQHCYKCHSTAAKASKGGLLVDTRDAIRRGGESGAAVVPGKPKESLLLDALSYSGDFYNMPPTGRLPAEVVADFRKWIELGAPDPRVGPSTPPSSISRSPANFEAGRTHWAYQPPKLHPIPTVNKRDWPLSDIDRFVLATLEKNKLAPAADSDRYTWLRRVHFDLVGLPPTPAEIDNFIKDQSPQAFGKVVDKLLASPGFGERWGRHWLDLTSYADTTDIQGDLLALNAWRYRDYVISSFNRDKPYNQFVTEQLAGDLLPASRDEQRNERLIATGFLAIGPYELVNPDKVKLRMDIVDHEIDKVGQVFLGQTLSCTRCHDHKFDPISQREYYALAGIFTSTETLVMMSGYGGWSGLIARPLAESRKEREAREQAIIAHDEKLVAPRKLLAESQVEFDRITAEIAAIKKPYASKPVAVAAGTAKPANGTKPEPEKSAGTAAASPSTTPSTGKMPPDVARRLKDLEKQLDQVRTKRRDQENIVNTLEYNRPAPPFAHSILDEEKIGDARLNLRGNPLQLGEVVPRGFLRVATTGEPPPIPRDSSGRLELARWLVDGRNPLTARVFVNRVWHHVFGAGIVRNVDYFGTRTVPPSHPELLDVLAIRFVQDGWSVKRLVREMVLSRTYRMSSQFDPRAAELDPDNRLLSRMNRRRLDADSLRDALLASSGRLSDERGGPSLPTEPVGNVRGLQKGNVNPPIISDDPQISESAKRRRTVYQPISRGRQFPTLEVLNVFDFPLPNDMTGARASTTIPSQALFLMNSPAIREEAQALADRLLVDKTADDAARIARLYLLTLNRPVTKEETAEALKFMQTFSQELGQQKDRPANPQRDAWTRYCHAVLASNEFLFAG